MGAVLLCGGGVGVVLVVALAVLADGGTSAAGTASAWTVVPGVGVAGAVVGVAAHLVTSPSSPSAEIAAVLALAGAGVAVTATWNPVATAVGATVGGLGVVAGVLLFGAASLAHRWDVLAVGATGRGLAVATVVAAGPSAVLALG